MTDHNVEILYQNGELTHGKFIELAMLSNAYKSMCEAYESEVNPEDEGHIDTPVIFYHEQHSWGWAWGGDAGRLNELESDGDYSVTKGRKLKCLGSAKLSSGYDLE